jgi:hypothetical protein
MPFGFGKKERYLLSFKTDVTEKGESDEIKKIPGRLDVDEWVLLVAKQSRVDPSGSRAHKEKQNPENKEVLNQIANPIAE